MKKAICDDLDDEVKEHLKIEDKKKKKKEKEQGVITLMLMKRNN